jgi:hypothetical protein
VINADRDEKLPTVPPRCRPLIDFTSVAELELAIDLYIAAHNAHPKPFIWTAVRRTSWPSSLEVTLNAKAR